MPRGDRSCGPISRSSPTTDHRPAVRWRRMGQGTLRELIADGLDAFNRGDYDAVVAQMSENVEFKRVDGLPDQDVLRGRAAVRAFYEPNVFDRTSAELVRMIEGEDVALAQIVFHARGAGSGIEL